MFKTLFSKEPLDIWDYAETKEVKTRIYLDFNETLPDVSDAEKELAEREKGEKRKSRPNPNFLNLSNDELSAEIAKGHSYIFVGKVGLYIPVKPGSGGGQLMAYRDGKYAAVTGTKDYRWQEFEAIRNMDVRLEDIIDIRYYRTLIDDAKDAISKYGDFEWFVSDDDPPSESNHPIPEDHVPWLMPCKDPNKNTCEDCDERERCLTLKESI